MKTLYLVCGQTGEYGDRTDWIVCGYLDRRKAEAHVRFAAEEATRLIHEAGHYGRVKLGANRYDPLMLMDYTGTLYEVGEIEIRDELP